MSLNIIVLSILGIIAVAELANRLGARVTRRPQLAAGGKHAGWYCFFRTEDLTGPMAHTTPAAKPVTAHKRPRPVLHA